MDADRRRVTRRRSVLAGISLVLACSTILVATIAVWAHQVAFNTDRFTALAANALEQPEVIDPLAARKVGRAARFGWSGATSAAPDTCN